MSLHWGVLGTGWIARQQVADLQLAGLEVAAVGSRTAGSARAFADGFGIPVAHGSYEALVADPSVDVVYVATPHPFHAEHALLALRAGKHVLVEKPFTINAAEATAVFAEAAERGLVALEAMWTRFLPHMVRIRELIADGALGEVRTVIADHDQLLPADPHHRVNDLALGGGALLDLGVYPVSFAHDVLGTPSGALASGRIGATGADTAVAAILDFPTGAQAVVHCALDAAGPNRAAVIGTAGRVELDSVWYTPTSFTAYAADGTVREHWDSEVPGRGMQFQALEVERLVAAGETESPLLSPAQTIAVMRTLDAIRGTVGVRYAADEA